MGTRLQRRWGHGVLSDHDRAHLAAAVASDRLFLGFYDLVLEATLTLVEEEILALVPVSADDA